MNPNRAPTETIMRVPWMGVFLSLLMFAVTALSIVTVGMAKELIAPHQNEPQAQPAVQPTVEPQPATTVNPIAGQISQAEHPQASYGDLGLQGPRTLQLSPNLALASYPPSTSRPLTVRASRPPG